MKPIFNIEILINENTNNVYVYKLQQEDFRNKNQDIRDITNMLLTSLNVNRNHN